MIQEKVTVKDLMGIHGGNTAEFHLPDYASVKSAMSLASQASKLYPRDDVARYQCKTSASDGDGSYFITITAIPKEA